MALIKNNFDINPDDRDSVLRMLVAVLLDNGGSIRIGDREMSEAVGMGGRLPYVQVTRDYRDMSYVVSVEKTVSQSVRGSAVETVVSTALGYAASYWVWILVGPLMGYEVTHHDTAIVTGIFTAVSLARGFAVRRLFNFIGRNQ